MLENKNKSENLMNLVMQLRKVCNHAELFERRPSRSPMLFHNVYYYTVISPKLNDIQHVYYNAHNLIAFKCPKLVFDEMLACDRGTIDQKSVFVSRISGLNLFYAEYINRSIFKENFEMKVGGGR